MGKKGDLLKVETRTAEEGCAWRIIAQACKDELRKAEMQNDLQLAREMKGKQTRF